jgi:hypothetical protein
LAGSRIERVPGLLQQWCETALESITPKLPPFRIEEIDQTGTDSNSAHKISGAWHGFTPEAIPALTRCDFDPGVL